MTAAGSDRVWKMVWYQTTSKPKGNCDLGPPSGLSKLLPEYQTTSKPKGIGIPCGRAGARPSRDCHVLVALEVLGGLGPSAGK